MSLSGAHRCSAPPRFNHTTALIDRVLDNQPVSAEICGTFLGWRDKQGYGEKEVRR